MFIMDQMTNAKGGGGGSCWADGLLMLSMDSDHSSSSPSPSPSPSSSYSSSCSSSSGFNGIGVADRKIRCFPPLLTSLTVQPPLLSSSSSVASFPAPNYQHVSRSKSCSSLVSPSPATMAEEKNAWGAAARGVGVRLRAYRKEGRLLLKEVKAGLPRRFFRASRQDGRLRLYLITTSTTSSAFGPNLAPYFLTTKARRTSMSMTREEATSSSTASWSVRAMI